VIVVFNSAAPYLGMVYSGTRFCGLQNHMNQNSAAVAKSNGSQQQ